MSTTFSRGTLLKSVALATTAGAASPSLFAKTAAGTDEPWTGFTICDCCNHAPVRVVPRASGRGFSLVKGSSSPLISALFKIGISSNLSARTPQDCLIPSGNFTFLERRI